MEMVVNNSQFQGTPDDPTFRDPRYAPSFRNLQHRLADRIFDWARVGAVHLQAPPYYENVRALVSGSVAKESAASLPWGEDTTIIPLVGAEDVSRVAATLLASPSAPSQSVSVGQRSKGADHPHALDHLTHLWQYFRKAENRFETTDAIRVVTGRDPQTLEDFFRSNAEFITTAGQ